MKRQTSDRIGQRLNNQQPKRNGLFLVIEGTDGSGKGTQFELLKKRLQNEGYDVATFDFPRYDQPSSYFVHGYLNGGYGTVDEVGPYASSLFYALDRYDTGPAIQQALDDGKIVLANRFTASNMAHQGAKFNNVEERHGYFIWVDNLEFEVLHVPRPDMSVVLRVPANVAQGLVDKKEERDYTTKKRDIHEADINHLIKSVEVYDDLCQLFPKDFMQIDCINDDELMDIPEISQLLWEKVQPLLPPKVNFKPKTGSKPEKAVPNPYVEKTATGYRMTTPGRGFLKSAVTETKDNVYAFTNNLSPLTIAAAMARLSRRGDDMRTIILDEFATAIGKDERLLQRVITAYGDDSVQQLVGQYVVVENASNILTKKLEWGRLAAYLEQSTRYIYFDQKNAKGHYRYYVPKHFKSEVKKEYIRLMDQIFDLYSQMVHELTTYVQNNSNTPAAERDVAWKGATRAQACDAVRPVLPVATTATVGIYASGQALESLIMHLLSDELPEAKETGQKLLDQARQVIPTFLERADKPDRGGATIAYRANTFQAVKAFASSFLPQNYSNETESVKLTTFWPRNEIDLLPDMLYEHSSLPLETIKEEVASWPYDRKVQAFEAYMGERLNRRHKPGRALETAHYSWDLVCDYGIFRDLQRHRMVDDLEWQELSPRYGYEIPALVEEAGLSETFQTAFDISLQLYSYLQTAGHSLEAQYATLLGHKMRWKVTYNAREAFHLHELRTSPQGHPGYRKLVQEMHDKLAQVHPMLADSMIFVNKGEDAELTRLAAERYTQYKLQQLN